MEFSDDASLPPPSRPRSETRRRRRRPRQPAKPPPSGGGRDLLVRRLIALGVGALVLLLLVIGVKGCLNARKERKFENYARDLNGIVTQSKQLSTEFFNRLQNPTGAGTSELTFEAQIAADRGTAENLLQRIQNLSPPGEVAGAQSELELAFELRRDGLADISNQIKGHLTGGGRNKAIEAIANDMRSLLASDVLYNRARASIAAAYAQQKITGEPIQRNAFLPDLSQTNWLDPLDVGGVLAKVAGGTGAASSGLHGVALSSTVVQPGDVTLSPDTGVTFSGTPSEIDVTVENQGDGTEKGISVSYKLSSGGSGDTTIGSIAAGASAVAKIPIDKAPPANQEVTLTVTVTPVPGEEIEDNNESSYPVTFSG